MSLITAPFAMKAGLQSGFTGQSTGSVAIGFGAGGTGQATNAVAVGWQAGLALQGTGAISIGFQSGLTGQGAYSIALGQMAGTNSLRPNTIAIDAMEMPLNPAASGLYIQPINITTNSVLPTLTIDATTSQVVARPVGYSATRLNVYPMEIVTPTMTAATTAGVGGNYIASASSEFDANFPAWRAFDRNLTTQWATQGVLSNYWIRIQMPTTRNVTFMTFLGRTSTSDCANTFRVEGSNDGTNWTAITSTITYGNAYTRNNCAVPIPSGSRNFLYYRFFGLTSQGGAGTNPGLTEWRLLAPSTTAYPNSVNAVRYAKQGGSDDFTNATQSGIWAFSFTSRGGYVEVATSASFFAASTNAIYQFNMYIDGSFAANTFSSLSRAYIFTGWWNTVPTLWWGGVLPTGDHTILIDTSFGVMSNVQTSGANTDQSVSFNVTEYI